MLARAHLLEADVQTALVSLQKGSAVAALSAAKEAARLLEGSSAWWPLAVQLLANAHLLNGEAEEALERAEESEQLGQLGAQGMALLMQAGAQLLLKDFGKSAGCAAKAKERGR